MKRTLILFFLLPNLYLSAQIEPVELQSLPLRFDPVDFYIAEVIDGRKIKSNIGIVQVGLFNKKVNADIADGVETGFYNFLTSNMPVEQANYPVVMRIVHLKISEFTSGLTEYGRAEIKIEFYKSEDGRLGKLFEAESYLEEPGNDVTKSHERRIRIVLEDCLLHFAQSEWKTMNPEMRPSREIYALRTDITNTTFKNDMHQRLQWHNLVTFSKSNGINASGIGIKYSGYTTSDTSWFFPYVISFEFFSLDFEQLSNKYDCLSAELRYYLPGISAYRRISDRLYINLTCLIPIGTEEVIDSNNNLHDGFLIGLAPSQGIHFIPKSKFGLTFGIEVYERVMTSMVYKYDAGIRAMIGLKF